MVGSTAEMKVALMVEMTVDMKVARRGAMTVALMDVTMADK